jgi:hypothetical protein
MSMTMGNWIRGLLVGWFAGGDTTEYFVTADNTMIPTS